MSKPAIFINCFEVPAGREDEFVAMWEVINRFMREQPGFISNRLHRATTPDARFRFVNYVHWRSEADWRAAHDDRFRALMQQQANGRDFPFTGALYDVVMEHAATSAAA